MGKNTRKIQPQNATILSSLTSLILKLPKRKGDMHWARQFLSDVSLAPRLVAVPPSISNIRCRENSKQNHKASCSKSGKSNNATENANAKNNGTENAKKCNFQRCIFSVAFFCNLRRCIFSVAFFCNFDLFFFETCDIAFSNLLVFGKLLQQATHLGAGKLRKISLPTLSLQN